MADSVAEAKRLKVERMEPYYGADAEELAIDEVKKREQKIALRFFSSLFSSDDCAKGETVCVRER